MSRSPSSSPPLDSPSALSPGPPLLATQLSSQSETPRTILFESYLQKTPPLSSLIMKWTKRWFVLSRTDPSDPSSLELCYYRDESRREKRGSIDLTKFVGIRPNARIGNKENVFAIETEERKYILKAADITTKNIWLAKLCEMCGQEQVYHITVPQQPSAAGNEAIAKCTTSGKLVVILPSTGATLLEVSFEDIRRLGCMDTYATDIVWFETCKNSAPENFYFFSVPTGISTAQQIVQEVKTAMEAHLSALLIMEDSTDPDISFISREHYGCSEFSSLARGKILQSGLRQVPPRWRSSSCDQQQQQQQQQQHRMRRESEPSALSNGSGLGGGGEAAGGVSLEEWATGKSKRKLSISSSSPHPPLSRKPTLETFRQASSFSSEHGGGSPSFDGGQLSDSGCASDVFDPPVPSSHNNHHSPNSRRLSHKSSVSSQSSATSLPYSPTIPEENGLLLEEDPFDEPHSAPGTPGSTGRTLTPVVPPRSIISLQQAAASPYFRQNISAGAH